MEVSEGSAAVSDSGIDLAGLRDDDDAGVLLPVVPDLTTAEAEELGCWWVSPESNPELMSRPVDERKQNVFAVIRKWVDDGVCSSYITVTMVKEMSFLLNAISGIIDGEDVKITPASEEYGRSMLKVLRYMLLTGEYPVNDDKLDWLFDVMGPAMQSLSQKKHGTNRVPFSLNTIGEVRSFVGTVTFIADVFEHVGYDDNPIIFTESDNDLGMRINNPVVNAYVAAHPESASALAAFMVERGTRSDIASGELVVEWYESEASPLKVGSL